MRPNLKGFLESGVVFEDNTVEEDIDAVIFCTGYKTNFPFLPPSFYEETQGELMLYKRLFPPSLQPPTLAIMGLFQTKGPIMPVVEMQARWAVRLFSGLTRLPPQEKMLEVTEAERKRNMESFPCPRLAALQVDYIPYLDFMAKEVGARPNLVLLFLSDPVLWLQLLFGPCTPYQYRLSGPGRWGGARHAILTQWKRVFQPFKTRPGQDPEPEPGSSILSVWLLSCAASVIMALVLSKDRLSPALQSAARYCHEHFVPWM